MPAEAAPADSPPRRPSLIPSLQIRRFLPTRRSLAAGAAVVALAAAGYAIARETSLFAIQRVAVTGGSAVIDAQVTRALQPFVGRSLVGLDGGAVLRSVDALPTVVSASYDRGFPSTLNVTVVPERPVAVLRDGAAAWIVSARGRVIRPVAAQGAPTWPRIWVAAKFVRVGEVLPLRLGGVLTRVLSAARPLRTRILTASITNGVLVFHLRSGLQLVLGAPDDVALKTAVAVQVLPQIPSGTRSLDVSVPSRPLASPYPSSSLG